MSVTILRTFSSPAVRYFQEVARVGSFRKAADQLNVAVSAVHRQVGLLEEQIGTPLFERSPGRGGLKLTAAGEVLVHRLHAAMGEVSTAIREIESLSGVQRGLVQIGTSDVLAIDFLPHVLARFKRAHPRIGVHVRVGTAQMVDELLDHQFDALLSFDAPPRVGMNIIADYALKSCVLAPKGHPITRKKSVSFAELVQYPLILPASSEYIRGFLQQMFHEAGVRSAPFIQTDSFILMRDLVDDGLGVAIQTELPGFSTRRNPNLVYVPLKESLARYSRLTCSVANARRLPIAARLFVDMLLEEMKESFGQSETPVPGVLT